MIIKNKKRAAQKVRVRMIKLTLCIGMGEAE